MNNLNLSKIITIMVLIIVIIAVILLFNGNSDTARLELVGLTDMTVYQNDQFKDPGYKIVNGNENNGYYVNVDGFVNTNKMGVYYLKYMLYNKNGKLLSTVNRKVIVLEDNLTSVTLELKGESEEYFFVNDYTDSGAEAYQRNSDISNLISVDSNVSPSTPGEYEVRYELKINNKVKEVIRKVYIIDVDVEEDIDLLNLTINLLLKCDSYGYTVLPDGTKEYSKDISYKFDSVGEYEFDITLKNGSHKKYIVNIDTIDNEGPTGKCTVSYDNNTTTINVIATDPSGVTKYSYNGLEFYTPTTTINSIATNVTIKAYDKFNNVTSMQCKATYGTGFRNIDTDSSGHVKRSGGYIVCNTSTSAASKELDNIVQMYGYKTRDAVAAAGLYLATYKYAIPYFWGGKSVKKGFDTQWGCRHSHSTEHNCSKPLTSDKSYCEYGLDCAGFTRWAFVQAGFDPGILRGSEQSEGRWGNFLAKSHCYKFNTQNKAYVDQIKPGDIVHKPGHVGLVIGVDATRIQVAEMTGPIIIDIISKDNGRSLNSQSSFVDFVLFDDFYKEYGNN